MMKNVKLMSVMAAAAIATLPMTASAEVWRSGAHALSANVTLATDYAFRGISQTDENPAIQGGIDYAHDSGIYVGVWASNVDSDFFSGASSEWDFYAGFATSFLDDNLGWDIWALRYQYPGTSFGDNNTNEFGTSLSYDFGLATPSFAVNYSPDFFGFDSSWYYDLSIDVPLPAEFGLSAHYGWTRFSKSKYDDADYNDWKVAVTKTFLNLDWELAYTDTASWSGKTPDIAEGRGILSVSYTF